MKHTQISGLFKALGLAAVLAPSVSFATPIDDPKERDIPVGAGTPSNQLPPPKSGHDPAPPVASPSVPSGGVVKQAGVGGQVAYGRTGVLELGGSASFTKATDFTSLSIAPSIGWFFMDNLEISAILSLSHLKAGATSATFLTALLEPSFHIPFSDTLFGFAGVGGGLSWLSNSTVGFAIAPRVGLNAMIGRSGVLTPQVFLQYSTHDAIQTPQGTLLAVSTSYGAGIGYTVMW